MNQKNRGLNAGEPDEWRVIIVAPNVNDKLLGENGDSDSGGYQTFFEPKQVVDARARGPFTFEGNSKETAESFIAKKTSEHFETFAAILTNLQLAMMKLEEAKKQEKNEDTKKYLESMIEMIRQESFITKRISDVLIE